MLHGTLYLRADGNDFDVYLWPESLSSGRIRRRSPRCGSVCGRPSAGNKDGHPPPGFGRRHRRRRRAADGLPAESVVASAAETGRRCSRTTGARPDAVSGGRDERRCPAGQEILCTIANNQVATVEYWYYLEGCDENCINAVQSRDAILQLGFAGVQAGA
jgi:hypothetical protein